MKKILLIAFVLTGLGSFIFAYTTASRNNIAQASGCQATCIELREDKAVPDTVAIPRGSTVQINSADGKSHSLSLGKGGEEHDHHGTFNSGTFKADEGWQVKFDEDGSYIFHDHDNPKINILVVVYTPGEEYKIQR